MAARRCSHCDINFPFDRTECESCQRPTWEMRAEGDTWDTDWKDKVKQIKIRHRPGTPIPDLRESGQPIEREGRLFVADALLRNVGYHDLESGDIVKINGEFYEVLSAIYRNTDVPAWWIQLVPLEGVWPDEHAVLSDFDYETLQKKRLR